MRARALFLMIFLISAGLCQAATMTLLYPDASATSYSTSCNDGAWCSLEKAEARNYCTVEGQYIFRFDAGPDRVTNHDWTGALRDYAAGYSHNVNWDQEKWCKGVGDEIRECLPVYTEWDAGACCGASSVRLDGRDCGWISPSNNAYLCGEVEELEYEWASHSENTGDIYDYSCANASVVSDGSQWWACGDILQLTSTIPKLDMTSITRGSTTHGYVCGEINPANIEGYSGIIECVGRGAAMSSIEGGVATTGENISPALLFRTTTSGDSLTQIQSQYNFYSPEGKIKLQITPDWNGEDTEPRIFFSIDDHESGVGNYIRIRKTGTEIICEYNTEQINFDISDYMVEDGPIDIEYLYEAGGQFSCTIGEETKSAIAGPQLNAVKINMGDHAQTGEEANAQIYVEVYGSRNPWFYYCSDDAIFRSDLDNIDPDVGYETCEVGAGLIWTGTKCCSEADDTNENYNDIGGTGACYQNTGYFNGEPAANETLISVEGEWYGCDLENTNTELLTLMDTHTGTQLIQDNKTCEAFTDIDAEDNNYVCTTQGQWKWTPSRMEHIPKSVPFTGPPYDEVPESECCGLDSCWNGTQCIGNQVNESIVRTFEGYRCINGQWGAAAPKKTWDRSSRGYCPEETDCLIHPLGDYEDNYKPEEYTPGEPQEGPACIANTQNIGQYICDGGAWSTRTKWIGLQLMDIPSGDYRIFCDEWEEILNFVDYKDIEDARAIQEYIGQTCLVGGQSTDCVNEFCAVKYDDKVAFGTSLNIPIDDSGDSFLRALGGLPTGCDNAKDGDEYFDSCNGIPNVYYNNKINSVIYAEDNPGRRTFSSLTSSYFLPELNTSIEELTEFNEEMALLEEYAGFFSESTLFNKWYKQKEGNKDYFGYMGMHQWNGSYLNYLGVWHQNIPATDPDGRTPCDMVESVVENDRPRDCEYDGDLKFVVYTTEYFGNVREAWRDLTSKLR